MKVPQEDVEMFIDLVGAPCEVGQLERHISILQSHIPLVVKSHQGAL